MGSIFYWTNCISPNKIIVTSTFKGGGEWYYLQYQGNELSV